MKKIGGWKKRVKIGCLAVAVAWSTFQMPVFNSLAAYNADNIEEMTAKDRTFELVPLPCIHEAAKTGDQTTATPSQAQGPETENDTVAATPSEAQESTTAEETTQAVQENTTADETAQTNETPTAEESAPAIEETPAAEESAPTIEETPAAEESAPANEETLAVEESASMIEETPAAEESAPAIEETPAVEESISAIDETQTIGESTPASDEAAQADDNGFLYWAEDIEVEKGTADFNLYEGIVGNKKGYFVGEDMVEYSELLDTEVPGDYEVAYVIADPSGKVVESFSRTVTVKEENPEEETDETATPSQASEEKHDSGITLVNAEVQQDSVRNTEEREAEKTVRVQLRGASDSLTCYVDSNPKAAEYNMIPEDGTAVTVEYDENAGVYEGTSDKFIAELGVNYYLHVIAQEAAEDFPLDLCGPVLNEENTKFYEEAGNQVYDIGLELQSDIGNSIAWIGWSDAADSAADLNQLETYSEPVKSETYQIRLSSEEIAERVSQGDNCICVYAGDTFGNVNEIPVEIRQQEQLSFTVTQSVGVDIHKTEDGCQVKSGDITVTNGSEVPVRVLLTAVEESEDSSFRLAESKETLAKNEVYLELVSNDGEQQRLCLKRDEYPVHLTDLQPELSAAYHLDGACSRDITENINGSFDMKFRITPVTEQ